MFRALQSLCTTYRNDVGAGYRVWRVWRYAEFRSKEPCGIDTTFFQDQIYDQIVRVVILTLPYCLNFYAQIDD